MMIRLGRPLIIQADGKPAPPLSTRESHPFQVQSDSVFDATQGWAGALPLPLRPRRLAGFSAGSCLRRETDTRPQLSFRVVLVIGVITPAHRVLVS